MILDLGFNVKDDEIPNLGITGTRSGMNEIQKKNVFGFLRDFISYYDTAWFHHGDCVGVDVEAARMAMDEGYGIICHPPIDSSLRGFFKSDETRLPDTYFRRNRHIVDACQILMVVPYQNEPQKAGGTWYTYDYALKQKKPIKILYPDGRII